MCPSLPRCGPRCRTGKSSFPSFQLGKLLFCINIGPDIWPIMRRCRGAVPAAGGPHLRESPGWAGFPAALSAARGRCRSRSVSPIPQQVLVYRRTDPSHSAHRRGRGSESCGKLGQLPGNLLLFYRLPAGHGIAGPKQTLLFSAGVGNPAEPWRWRCWGRLRRIPRSPCILSTHQ